MTKKDVSTGVYRLYRDLKYSVADMERLITMARKLTEKVEDPFVELPDWVRLLANGNPEKPGAVIDEAHRELEENERAEREELAKRLNRGFSKSERGQGEAELVLILGGVVALIFAVLMILAALKTPQAVLAENAAALPQPAVIEQAQALSDTALLTAEYAVSPFMEKEFEMEITLSHAFERHGEDALTVQSCLASKGALQRWYNPTTKRIALICQVEEDLYGLEILDEAGNEITAFLKNQLRRVEQVIRYMYNRGYIPQ